MTLEQLIESAAKNLRVEPADLQAVASNRDVPVSEVIDAFARRVAEGYVRGDYSYWYADEAMNALFGILGNRELELTALGWKVYLAFDQGEFSRAGHELQGEELTRHLLEQIPELKLKE